MVKTQHPVSRVQPSCNFVLVEDSHRKNSNTTKHFRTRQEDRTGSFVLSSTPVGNGEQARSGENIPPPYVGLLCLSSRAPGSLNLELVVTHNPSNSSPTPVGPFGRHGNILEWLLDIQFPFLSNHDLGTLCYLFFKNSKKRREGDHQEYNSSVTNQLLLPNL